MSGLSKDVEEFFAEVRYEFRLFSCVCEGVSMLCKEGDIFF